ncbi:unnamed protein product [Cylindrotheca closterium]|uniref:Helicase-associated domain-containing protein n=1 Tax=Cylindrotheca closterium TaxID=2856 RepID=A0AAD2FZ37_9STRA|nr:unnamed protein product [Cylindrotheca closterium]
MITSPQFRVPSSFEDPFDDLRMEPSPLRSQGRLSTRPNHNGPQMQSICLRDDCMSNNTTLGQEDKSSIFARSKKCLGGFVSSHNLGGSGNRKRTSQLQATSNKEESIPRFRPYQDKQWRAQFQRLIQYKLKNGHCCVPHCYPEDPALARWVKRQRYQYKKFQDGDTTSTMSTPRIQELESVGFVWHSHASAWQEKFNELKEFKQRTGHCNVPSAYPENNSLSTWVKCQRRHYKAYISGSSSPSPMTMHRLQLLESLDFVFEPQLSKRWDSN